MSPSFPPFLVSAVLAVHFKLTSAFKIQNIEKNNYVYVIHNCNTFMISLWLKGKIPLQLFWNIKAVYFRYALNLKSKT